MFLCNCIHVTGDSPVTGLYTNKFDLIWFVLIGLDKQFFQRKIASIFLP